MNKKYALIGIFLLFATPKTHAITGTIIKFSLGAITATAIIAFGYHIWSNYRTTQALKKHVDKRFGELTEEQRKTNEKLDWIRQELTELKMAHEKDPIKLLTLKFMFLSFPETLQNELRNELERVAPELLRAQAHSLSL